MNKPINVVFTIDKNYTSHFAVALTSLLETNRALVGRVFLVTDNDDEHELRMLQDHFQKKYGITLEFLSLDASVLDNIKVTHHLAKATAFRLLLDRIIPADVDSVLLLDSDLVVNGDLSELANLNFEGTSSNAAGNSADYLIYAVDHRIAPAELLRLRDTGFHSDKYFNAGVLYIDIKKWRDLSLSDQFMQVVDRFSDYLLWMDQDVLNITLENRWGELDAKYNGFGLLAPDNPDVRIIHYTGSSKPWHLSNKHPYKKLYWKYRRMTPYSSFFSDDFSVRSFLGWMTPAPVKRVLKRLIGSGRSS